MLAGLANASTEMSDDPMQPPSLENFSRLLSSIKDVKTQDAICECVSRCFQDGILGTSNLGEKV